MSSWLIEFVGRVAQDVWGTVTSLWPFLVLSVVTAAALQTYVGTDRLRALIGRRVLLATVGAVALATLTPFCSCGTTAILLGMLAGSTPWAPIVAFLVSSPLTSPAELFLSAGLFGWEFALVFFAGTIALGLAAGGLGGLADRAGWLVGQARMQESEDCGSSCGVAPPVIAFGPGAASIEELSRPADRLRMGELGRQTLMLGRRLSLYFLGFTAVGYAFIEAIPTAWLVDHLSGDGWLGIPLAALAGVPVYLNTEASLPLVATLMEAGMGPGPAMAFLVTGAGTSIGAISGLFVIARGRVIGLVVATLLAGALALGVAAQVLL